MLVFDSLLTLLKLVFHRLDVLFLSVGVSDFSVELLVLVLDLFAQIFHLLLLVSVLVLDQSQLTLHLHAVVYEFGQIFLVFLFDLFDLVPGLIFNQFTLVFVALDHLLNLMRKSFFLGLFFFTLKDLVSIEIRHQLLMGQVGLTHQHFKLFEVFLLLSFQSFVALLVRSSFFSLVLCFFLEFIAVLVHLDVDLFLVSSLHVSGFLLDLFHLGMTILLFLFHFTSQIFCLFLVLSE